jgi:hypothetical protein
VNLLHALVLLVKREWQDISADCASRVRLRILLILVKRDHLAENILGNFVQRCKLERSDGHLDVAQAANDGLELGVVHAVQRLYHLQVVVLLLVFVYSSLDRREVLLVTEVDVVEQGTLAWEEGACQFERLGVPELALLLLLRRFKALVLFHLNNEANFRRVAEIGHSERAHFLDEGFTRELKLVLALLNEVFNLVGLQLHYTSDAEL